MHTIEPHFQWRDLYIASEDSKSPFFGCKYSEFYFTHKLYNYYLHPQWDEFGSSTLYTKVLFVDYDEGFALIELIGEWNDTLHNDIMFLKRRLIDPMLREAVSKFIFFCENVLNFHSAEDDYYAEWSEDVLENQGWIVLINTRLHVEEELLESRLQRYLHFGEAYNDINWRPQKPLVVFHLIQGVLNGEIKRLED
ncbi:MAG: hypothetical protein KGS48_01265 [Bacteroidetes bacterium]|nr:hypothetical protein [Bacteroidota bacterium]